MNFRKIPAFWHLFLAKIPVVMKVSAKTLALIFLVQKSMLVTLPASRRRDHSTKPPVGYFAYYVEMAVTYA